MPKLLEKDKNVHRNNDDGCENDDNGDDDDDADEVDDDDDGGASRLLERRLAPTKRCNIVLRCAGPGHHCHHDHCHRGDHYHDGRVDDDHYHHGDDQVRMRI